MGESRYWLPDDLAALLRSEWETIIEQGGFDAVDEGIIRDCILDRYTQAYAATGVNRTRSTVYRRLPRIVKRARDVAKKLEMLQMQQKTHE